MTIIKSITTEKAVRLIEGENTLLFLVEKKADKKQIKQEIEKIFKVKVEKIRILNKQTNKYAYIKLKKQNPAIDVATKLGMI